MADGLLVTVLAAGQARRFGGGKLDADCAGRPLAAWALDAVARAGLPPGLIISGPGGAQWAKGAVGSPITARTGITPGAAGGWTVLPNPRADEGLSRSLALAAEYALAGGFARMLVVLADMPLVDSAYLARMAALAGPAATLYPGGRAGVPALLDQDLLEQATQLTGDRGASGLLRSAALYEAPDGSLADVDTAEDLARIANLLQARRAP